MKMVRKAVTIDAWKVPAMVVDMTVRDAPSDDIHIPHWALLALTRGQWELPRESADGNIGERGFVETDRGRTGLSKGDWLVRSVKGDIYPCPDDLFMETHEYPAQEAVRGE